MSYLGFDAYQLSDMGEDLAEAIRQRVAIKEHQAIVNPCGEIPLSVLGGFCVIGDVAPYLSYIEGREGGGGGGAKSRAFFINQDDNDDSSIHVPDHAAGLRYVEDAARHTTRALIRTNLMRSIYSKEVERTNRIGVSLTGIHEFAWAAFQADFYDLIEGRADNFWEFVARLSRVVQIEATRYSELLGARPPETSLTMKPAGTTSKLFALTEGGHLPGMGTYLRWVQFRSDDPLIEEYTRKGYPVRRNLRTYVGVSIVGFPTITELARILPEKRLVTAGQAKVHEHFEWLRLLERHWLGGGNEDGFNDKGGQISYTLKYDPNKISMKELLRIMNEQLRTIKAISIMPSASASAYEYQPEEPINRAEYDRLVAGIDAGLREDIDLVHIDCPTGACPVDISKPDM